MPFFKDQIRDFRRKSKASFTTNNSQSSNDSQDGNQNSPRNNIASNPNASKSSSTIASMFSKSPPPPPSAQSPPLNTTRSQSSTTLNGMANGTRTPPPFGVRPGVGSHSNSRYSTIGSTNGTPKPPTSPLAPRVESVNEFAWVHQKVLLISGTIGESQTVMDGEVTICHHQDNFPPTRWPVTDSTFKALVYLQPGPNRLRLDFVKQARRPSQNSSPTVHSSYFQLNYLPMNNSPPLHLAILVAKDSPRTYDAMPDRIKYEGNNLETAVRKFRMAAYLWQAFTGEQMHRNGFGRRCFRYDEEWRCGTLHAQDMASNTMRNEAKIHVITLDKTLAEIQDLDLAQQYDKANRKGDLFSIASEACKKYFNIQPGQKEYVSCLYLDAHWDKKVGTVRAHAALGGGDDQLKLAIFGSHLLQSYPAHITEVVDAFQDCTRTDTNYVANDCNESGSSWEAANIGIGAHLHETGHLLGCPHQASGVMLRDYVTLNRTFMTTEAFSTRTGSHGMKVLKQDDECAWHRLDALRFRVHPCFAIPQDMGSSVEDSIQVWAVDKGTALVTASTGIAWIEIYVEGDELCRHWIEYIDQTNAPPPGCPRQVTLTEQELRERVVGPKGENKNKKLKLKIFSMGQGEHEIADFGELTSKGAKFKLPGGLVGCKGSKLGFSQMEGSEPQEVILRSSSERHKLLTCIRVYSGFALDGLEFVYNDGDTFLFGKRGGKAGGDEFYFDVTRKAETLQGFVVRSGAWIDGVQILTSTGRRSPFFGNANGGSLHTLIPPMGGWTVAGVYGSCGPWVDGFGLIITR